MRTIKIISNYFGSWYGSSSQGRRRKLSWTHTTAYEEHLYRKVWTYQEPFKENRHIGYLKRHARDARSLHGDYLCTISGCFLEELEGISQILLQYIAYNEEYPVPSFNFDASTPGKVQAKYLSTLNSYNFIQACEADLWYLQRRDWLGSYPQRGGVKGYLEGRPWRGRFWETCQSQGLMMAGILNGYYPLNKDVQEEFRMERTHQGTFQTNWRMEGSYIAL